MKTPITHPATVATFLANLLLLLALPLSASEPAAPLVESSTRHTAWDFIQNNKEYQIFSHALRTSGRTATLENNSSVSAFIVSDRSMAIEGSTFLLADVLLASENRDRLRSTMGLHLFSGADNQLSAPLADQKLRADSGHCVEVQIVGTGIAVGGYARVIERNVVSNGVVYVIDRLLSPTIDTPPTEC